MGAAVDVVCFWFGGESDWLALPVDGGGFSLEDSTGGANAVLVTAEVRSFLIILIITGNYEAVVFVAFDDLELGFFFLFHFFLEWLIHATLVWGIFVFLAGFWVQIVEAADS